MTLGWDEKLVAVYRIVNWVNGDEYIGSSSYVYSRWEQHWRDLEQGRHHSPYLQRAWAKYGRDSFDFVVLEFTGNDLLIREQALIDERKPVYNAGPVGRPPSQLGRRYGPRTFEQRQRIREAVRQNWESRYARFGKKGSTRVTTELVSLVCRVCEVTFQVFAYHALTSKFCSRECYHRSRRRGQAN